MKYCLSHKSKYADEVDEILINFNHKDLSTFLDFVRNRPKGQRILVKIKDEKDFIDNKRRSNFFTPLREEGIDIVLLIRGDHALWQQEFSVLAEVGEFPHFFTDIHCTSWDMLYHLASFKPTDILISEELCFELRDVAKFLHERDIKVRVYPDAAQLGAPTGNTLKSFFIRPEDVYAYEPYVDTLEFYLKDAKKVDVYYKIYAIDKKWFGNLKEIIIGLKEDIYSYNIHYRFAEKRINCGKSCLKNGKCQFCDRVEELANVLTENNLILK